jgi:hypothetical protein
MFYRNIAGATPGPFHIICNNGICHISIAVCKIGGHGRQNNAVADFQLVDLYGTEKIWQMIHEMFPPSID